jgi:two-component system sensor histidine kinase TctE
MPPESRTDASAVPLSAHTSAHTSAHASAPSPAAASPATRRLAIAATLKRWLAPSFGRHGEARSLFGEILDWMFAPLLLLWPMSVSITYLVAQSIASSPYDRTLVERGQALAEHVHFEGGQARFDLSPGLLEIYGTGVTEPATYVVASGEGRLLAGDPDLPRPRPAAAPPGGARPPGGPRAAEAQPDRWSGSSFQLRDDTLRGHAVRVAYAWIEAPGAPGTAPVLIEVAEPPAERTQLANEIIKGVILPQFVVLPLALLLVWFGLSRGLAPLARLQRTIRDRSSEDLSPINAEAAPEELSPLLASFNELLARMAHNLQVQKRFIADAAHQMKTPLAGLRTQAELAQREADANELQRSLRQIAQSTERATRMVNQLLALARAERGAGENAAMIPLDLDRLARSVVQEWVAPALSQGIDLGYEAPAGDCSILGTPMLLREMLNNLIDNALRYCVRAPARAGETAGNGAGEGPAVTVRLRRDGASVVLEVEDTGPGIAPEERALVFERFYRVLGTQKDGSGLGLAIVREIVLRHQAALELADARPRQAEAHAAQPGALFRITFAHAQAP